MFKKVQMDVNFAQNEQYILKKWKTEQTFAKSLEVRANSPRKVFFDGPPFANGLPHYGHILQSVLKDAVARYLTMQGNLVPRVAGWDCHGLPVENEVEKANDIKSKLDIEKIGVEKFNNDCRLSVFRYTSEFEKTFERVGRWVDTKNAYATLNTSYTESIWWVFKNLWDKGLVYRSYKPMHISTALETPLSNFEVSLNYKEVTDYTVIAKFPILGEEKSFFLAWTTTPWTLPGNQALAVGADLDYIQILLSGEKLILAKERLESVVKDQEFQILAEMKGSELIGKKYLPLFDYFKSVDQRFFVVLGADFINTEDGTGIVHIAGGFGEDDYNLISAQGWQPIIHVLMNGNFIDEVTDFAGKYVKGQDQNIAKFLDEKGLIFDHFNYRHSYPHCWRTDTPLLNYVTDSWFIKVTAFKDKMLANNQKIKWQPEHLKDGRFGKWLENARDWSISRNRYWGAPLPIWANENGDFICVGSLEELKKLAGKLPMRDGEVDLHKPYIDQITFPHPDHADSSDPKFLMKPVGSVFDCWFESGAMPYAQLHYPFENKELFEQNFPAEFISEAIDQTRGWFYTLHVLATALFDKPAFYNVICTGHVLAENGEKLSKRKKNFVDPSILFDKLGADPVRMFLYNSPVVAGEGVKFSERGVEEVLKKFNLTLWNTYSFFVTYANIDGWKPEDNNEDFNPTNPLDQWILSELQFLIAEMTEKMDQYSVMKATRPLFEFLDNLSNWFVRRSRRRFWKSEDDGDKQEAYQTLYLVLVDFCKLLAPFMPFISEEIFTNLTGKSSVHLESWPKVKTQWMNKNLNQQTALVRQVVALGHAVRDLKKIKVRQPLKKVAIALPAGVDSQLLLEQKTVILEELNVKDLEILADAKDLVKVVVKPNARVLGPKFGQAVQQVIKLVKEGEFKQDGDQILVGEWILEKDEYELGYESLPGLDAASENGVTVILNTEIDHELLQEGWIREIVRVVQDMRKEAGFEVSDRIRLIVIADQLLSEAITKFADYLAKETLAVEIVQKGDLEWDLEKELEIDGHQIKVAVAKI